MESNYDIQVQRAKDAFLQWDSRRIAERFSLKREGRWIYLPYLGRMHRINCETGDVEEQADGQWQPGSFGAHMAIFDALCRETVGTLSGKWATVNNLEGLVHPGVGEESMYRDAALVFSGKQRQLREIGEQWGAKPFPVGDTAFILQIFPFLPMVFQFWEGDDEFPPQIRLLWDRHMLSFVRYETIWYIAGDLLGKIKDRLGKESCGPNAQI